MLSSRISNNPSSPVRMTEQNPRLILAVEIGNTTLGVSVMQEGQVVGVDYWDTVRSADGSHYLPLFRSLVQRYVTQGYIFAGGALTSVVPPLDDVVAQAMQEALGQPVHVVTRADIEKRLPIAIEDPTSVGKDRLLDCLGAMTIASAPLLVIDMGTATTVNVVDAEGRFRGGMIIPGVQTSVNALSAKATLLPSIELVAPKRLLGQFTVECMQSGAVYGFAAMVDGLIDRICIETHTSYHVIATGGWGELIIPHCVHDILYDPCLQIKGLTRVLR